MDITYDWTLLSPLEKELCLLRPAQENAADVSVQVRLILDKVKKEKDLALFELTKKLDKADLKTLLVSDSELDSAFNSANYEIKEAIQLAVKNIWNFHKAQQQGDITVETMMGVHCERRKLPLESVGLYIPGGTAPLVSTLMMLAVPALIAGCKNIVLCTPPNSKGEIHPTILTAASMLGVKTIFKVGGAQAIAAMAYGTESIPKVQKIFGPGNAWVTEAKLQVSQTIDGAFIDMPAGPSEVLVIADSFSNSEFVAIDLLSQAEHDPSSQVVLVSNSKNMIEKTKVSIMNLVETLDRKDIIMQSLTAARFILVDDLNTAFEISNAYAPEHLILQIENANTYLDKVLNAGSVFVGPWTPESVGDYASGTNHVLPTYGYARTLSGLGLDAFQKSITFQELTPQGLLNIGSTVECLARTEGLSAHELAVTLRLKVLNQTSGEA